MRPEILAPAGSMEALKAAVHAGADAVYLGGDKFGARAYANNFDSTALIKAIEYAHLYGVKVYLTINTLFRNEEIQELPDYLTPLYKAGLDAVIVQDFGVMKYVHTAYPDLPIHASTQMTITTPYAYELLCDYGVTRIVPARELSVSEIATLKECEQPPEVEVFVQGALCYSYSGQCLMSSFLGGRSGNRGRCAQTCRLPYCLYNADNKAIESDGEYLLSPKDLCGLESIPDLIKAGVDSFKIEGRMKRPEYVAVCVRAYRKLIDAWYEGRFSDELIKHYQAEMAEVFNRGGFTKGYYHQRNGKNMMSVNNPGNIGVPIGKIISIQKNQITIRLDKNVYKGDILVPYGMRDTITLTNNLDGIRGQCIVLNSPRTKELYKGQMIHRMSLFPLMKELDALATEEAKIHLKGKICILTGESASLELETELKGKTYSCICRGDIVEQASSKPLTEETVRDKVQKTGNTRYHFNELDIQISEDSFYSLKSLKELRRNAIELLEDTILTMSKREYDLSVDVETVPNLNHDKCNTLMESRHSFDNWKNTVMVSREEQYQIVTAYDCWDYIYLDIQFFEQNSTEHIIHEKHNIAVVLPPILRANYLQDITSLISSIKRFNNNVAVVVRNIDELALLKNMNYIGQVITDYSVYTMNDWAAAFIQDIYPGVRITLPVELNEHQIRQLAYVSDMCEMEVYGYQQLMISAQCLKNTTNQCDKKNAHFTMKDRYLKNFSIFSVCKYCYNLIYNGIPTVLYDVMGRDLSDKVTKRLHFTVENADEVRTILDAYLCGEILEGDKTRGHYKRGVE